MIIPAIALQAGRVVGPHDPGEPAAVARRLAVAGELAVTDVDGALQRGHNRARVEEILAVGPARVGGGIRDMGTAEYWLDKGASHIVLGTAATPTFLRQLPRARVLAALDVGDGGEVLVDGRSRGTGDHAVTRALALRDLVAGFVVGFGAGASGTPSGLSREDMALAEAVARAVAPLPVTVSVESARAEDVAHLDALGLDLEVGAGLVSGAVDLAEALVAPMRRLRPEGPWPTVVCDEHGVALGLTQSTLASVREAVRQRRGVYASPVGRAVGPGGAGADGGLAPHGDGGDNWQDLLRVDLDRTRETLRFTVRQHGGGFGDGVAWTAWGPATGLPALARRLLDRVGFAPVGSYTRRLLDDPKLLRAKLIEEARELAQARGADEIVWEAADVFYFTMVSLARAGVPLADVGTELDRRARKIVRRKGEAKAVPPAEFLEDPQRPEEP